MKRFKYQLMVLGTGSHVGKSLVSTGLCRILNDRGYRVAPFKAQNMALNSGATLDGGEIGMAQLLQARAARCLAYREMNPILLKPSGNGKSQVIVLGRPKGLMSTREYFKYWPEAARVAGKAYGAMKEMFEALIIEGAGSPAEINLASHDLANLETARFSGSDWILVSDIERGGAFASVAGTLALLEPWMRRRCRGVVFNKFRGDPRLLDSGLRWMREKLKVECLGVIPFLEGLQLEEEDSLGMPKVPKRSARKGALRVEVVQPSTIANFNDLQPLLAEADLDLRWRKPGEAAAGNPDLVVIAGSKFTLADMEAFNRSGESRRLRRLASEGVWMLGICGGLQMFGHAIDDAEGIDGRKGWNVKALGVLDVHTTMHPLKISEQVEVRAKTSFGQFELKGYEMHHGRTSIGPEASEHVDAPKPLRPLLSSDPSGRVWGSYMHAILDNDKFRRALFAKVAQDRGRSYRPGAFDMGAERERDMQRWASHLEKHLRLDRIKGFPKAR